MRPSTLQWETRMGTLIRLIRGFEHSSHVAGVFQFQIAIFHRLIGIFDLRDWNDEKCELEKALPPSS